MSDPRVDVSDELLESLQEATDIVVGEREPAREWTRSATQASAILLEAAEIVGGARNATHGDKERSFQVIADLWNAYLGGRPWEPRSGVGISARDVASMMVLLKLARSIQGQPVRDHFLDMAGYAAIAGELAE